MPEDRLLELSQDIKQNGQKEAVVLYEGMILDGWHRHQACQIAGISTRAHEYKGDDPAGFVESKNAHRRDLTASQRAAIIVALRDWSRQPGRPKKEKNREPGSPFSPQSNSDLAAAAGVSTKTIKDAKTAHEAGLGDAVRNGEKSAKQAASEARGKPAEKKPSQIEKLKAEIAEYKSRIQDLEESIDNLTDEIRLADLAGKDKSEQLIELEKAQLRIRTLESQVREHQNIANDWKKEALALRKKVGQ